MTTPIGDKLYTPKQVKDMLGMQGDKTMSNMTLREYYAGQQVITDDDSQCWELCETLAGPRPEGTWQSNPMTWAEWEAKWRAALCFLRADAMLAESQKRTIGRQ